MFVYKQFWDTRIDSKIGKKLVTKSHEFNWSMLLHLWVKDSQCIIKIGTYNKKLDRGGATA